MDGNIKIIQTGNIGRSRASSTFLIMKIAIHYRENSLAESWIEYCKKNKIDYKIVNCYSSDIIKQMDDCQVLLWNWVYWHSRDVLIAKQLIYSLEASGKIVYPNTKTCQFFDDKIGQKYLMEALHLPLINTEVFFYKKDAIDWIKSATFPKVFKLRGGASSVNVKLVKNKKNALRLVRKSFGRGFSSEDRFSNFNDRLRRFKKSKNLTNFIHLLKGVIRIFYPNEHAKVMPRERSYIYFQDFLPGNKFDIRVVVIGDYALAMKRMVRKNDFRASGSGNSILDPEQIDPEFILLAFEVNDKLNMQSVAFDFLSHEGKKYLVEMSYNFVTFEWPGYWDRDGKFHNEPFSVPKHVLENTIKN